MRPLSITMQAFGPFSGCETVDFSRLGSRAFFLIHGPTGAGKTTLLDAICFALYGDTSGGERQARAMRSDHAAPDKPTRVEFEFSLGDARYRIERAPVQLRPKLRGSGTVEVSATAELSQWRDGSWVPLAQQPQKVGDAVRELIGFDDEQFRQVIVLPQGRFREVLTADSKKREEIMERLFRTELYRRVEEALKRAAGGLKHDVQRIEQERIGVLKQVDAESEPALGEQLLVQSTELGLAEVSVVQALTGARAARDALEAGRRAKSVLQECCEADAALNAQMQRVPEQEHRRECIAFARRALQVVAEEQRSLRADKACAKASRALEQSATALAEARTAAAEAMAACDQERGREPERVAAHQRIGELEIAARNCLAWQRAVNEATKVERELGAVQHAADRRAAEIDALRRRAGAAETEQRALQPLAVQVPALRMRDEHQAAQLRRRRELGQAQIALEQAEKECASTDAHCIVATARWEQARARCVEVERRWIAGQASRLAASLVAGETCPVCGGRDHPAPATVDADHVSDETLEAARDMLKTKESALGEAREARADATLAAAQARQRCILLAQDLGDVAVRGVTELEVLQQACALELEQAEAAEKALAAGQAALAAARDRISEIEAEQLLAAPRLAMLLQTTACLVADARALENCVPKGLRVPGALSNAQGKAAEALKRLKLAQEQAQARHTNALAALNGAEAAHVERAGAVRLAEEEQAVAREAFVAALAAHGFSDQDACIAARLPDDQLAVLEATATKFDEVLAAVRERHARAKQAARGVTAPDLGVLEMRATEAETAATRAAEQAQALRARLGEMGRARDRLEKLAAEREDIEQRFRVIGRLAEVAGGANSMRMTFQRYVLATLLDEVLEAASLRLHRMSRGRYHLQRVMEAEDKRSAGGLDLEVFDHQTGRARPANTLSGGEGFLAALSLALGLADVVQSRTGGIQLETLFVDEGFGTLDPESLDFAINTLIDLQQGGRLVGIISHVAELKERIDVRLEVRPSASGSSIAFRI